MKRSLGALFMTIAALPLSIASSAFSAAHAEAPAPYAAQQQVEGTIRIWGHGAYGKRLSFVEGLVAALEDGFRRVQPKVVFDNRLHGTASAIGALYTDQGDVAFMGREIWNPEIKAFQEVRGYSPTGVDVMTGSFDVRNKGYAITIFTHRDNPIKGLTLAQLDAIYSVERRRGNGAVATWGDLGLTGEWADKPVRLYGLPIARGFADFVQERVFLGSQIWKPELNEFPDDAHSVSATTDGANRMLAAMATDRYAIGYAGMVYSHPHVRVIPIAEQAGQPFVMPNRATVQDRSYPLHRIISFFIDKVPGKRADPKVEEFMNFVLSQEGQAIIEREGGGYLPLNHSLVETERKKLEP